jgi:hypothetical protein
MNLLRHFTLGLLIASALTLTGQDAPSVETDMTPACDRIELISQFLRVVYPELAATDGMLTIDAIFPHAGDLYFTFRRCRSGSGTAGGRLLGQSMPKQIPNCWPKPVGGGEDFLSARISWAADKHRPISSFFANGNFLMGSGLGAIREEFRNRVYSQYDLHDKQRYWTDDDALRALRSKNPKYGPDNKKEFVTRLPVAGIERLTGCRLLPQSSRFEIKLTSGLPGLEWIVSGSEAATETSSQGTCSAAFEPFNGRLTSLVL